MTRFLLYRIVYHKLLIPLWAQIVIACLVGVGCAIVLCYFITMFLSKTFFYA